MKDIQPEYIKEAKKDIIDTFNNICAAWTNDPDLSNYVSYKIKKDKDKNDNDINIYIDTNDDILQMTNEEAIFKTLNEHIKTIKKTYSTGTRSATRENVKQWIIFLKDILMNYSMKVIK